MFVIGFSMAARAFVGYLFMTENMRIKDFSYATAVMFTIDSLGILISSIYFKHISRNWKGLFGFPLILQFIATVAMYYEKETPKFYYGIADYMSARDTLTRIGRRNGVLSETETFSKSFYKELKAEKLKEEHDLSINQFL